MSLLSSSSYVLNQLDTSTPARTAGGGISDEKLKINKEWP